MRRAVLVFLLAVFAFLHLYRMGAIGFTWDEGSDLGIVQCLQRTHNPFACLDDISQTRFPFYVHAVAGSLREGNTPHFLVSFLFSAITLFAVYTFAKKTYGAWTATLFVALYVTSPAMLAAGRMVLTHSSIIFTCFTTLSMLALLQCRAGFSPPVSAQRPEDGLKPVLHSGSQDPGDGLKPVLHSALFTGLAAASHILAAFNGIFLVAIYARCRKSGRHLLFVPLALATFFAATIVYCSPHLLRELILSCFHGGEYPFWNYLGLGSPRAPWFFPFLLLILKVGPWLVFAFHREARWFLIALGIDLALKGTVFGYETPHHQVQFYPLLYLYIAVGIMKWGGAFADAPRTKGRGRVVLAIVVALFAVQVRDVVRFFPNYLFWGSQYGERFIGEFYGPAVIHAQGRDPIWEFLRVLQAREPDAKILIADNNAFDLSGPPFVPYTKRDPQARYEYALVDRLYATHFVFPERDAYNALLARDYEPLYTTWFPPHVWVYRVMKLRR